VIGNTPAVLLVSNQSMIVPTKNTSMMNKLITITSILLLSLIVVQLSAQAFKLNTRKSEVAVLGTSTIHDWEIVCKELSGNAQIQISERKLNGIKNLEFQVVVKSMESGKGLMNNKTYDALEEEEHPTIKYKLSEVKNITSETNGSFTITALGMLTIAGKTNNISHEVTAIVSGKEIIFSGEYHLDMTTYDVAPPTAMMGTIKTGKEVTIKFETTFLIN